MALEAPKEGDYRNLRVYILSRTALSIVKDRQKEAREFLEALFGHTAAEQKSSANANSQMNGVEMLDLLISSVDANFDFPVLSEPFDPKINYSEILHKTLYSPYPGGKYADALIYQMIQFVPAQLANLLAVLSCSCSSHFNYKGEGLAFGRLIEEYPLFASAICNRHD